MNKQNLPYANKGNLVDGPVLGHLVRMTVPMIWGLLAIISVQLADTWFVSMLGATELAGISFTFPVTMIISHIVFGLNIALASVVSRLIGEKKIADVRRVTLHGIILATIAAAIVAIVTYIFHDALFLLLGADEKTLPIVRAYMPVWLIASVILAIPVNCNSAMRAAGDTLLPSLVMIGIAIVNFLLCPVFIFGWFGIPALGVFGAAVATLLAYICGMFGALYILIAKKDMLSLEGLHLDKFRDSFFRLVVIALPVSITTIIGPAANAITVSILAAHGAETVAGYGIVTRVEAFSLILVIALSLGMSPIVGQNWGAGNYARARQAINLAIIFNFVWSFAIAAIFGFFARPIATAFSSQEEIIHTAELYFWIVPFSYAFGNLVFGWSSAFNAMGKPKRSFTMIATKTIVMTIPALYIGDYLGGSTGIFWSIALVNILSGIIFHVISSNVWKKWENLPPGGITR